MKSTVSKGTTRRRKPVSTPKAVTAKRASKKKAAQKRAATVPAAAVPVPQPPVAAASAPESPKAQSRPASKRQKSVRDSFNMPAEDYALIAVLKKRALAVATEVKKSELLRAGLRMLAAVGADEFKAAIAALPAVKVGRPEKKLKK